MSTNLPAVRGGALALAANRFLEDQVAPTQEELREVAEAIGDAGSAAERADKHVQLWREGMAKLILSIAFRDDPELDRAFGEIKKLEGYKILERAALESPKIMAELRSYWNPEDKVRVP